MDYTTFVFGVGLGVACIITPLIIIVWLIATGDRHNMDQVHMPPKPKGQLGE